MTIQSKQLDAPEQGFSPIAHNIVLSKADDLNIKLVLTCRYRQQMQLIPSILNLSAQNASIFSLVLKINLNIQAYIVNSWEMNYDLIDCLTLYSSPTIHTRQK